MWLLAWSSPINVPNQVAHPPGCGAPRWPWLREPRPYFRCDLPRFFLRLNGDAKSCSAVFARSRVGVASPGCGQHAGTIVKPVAKAPPLATTNTVPDSPSSPQVSCASPAPPISPLCHAEAWLFDLDNT